MFVFVLVFQNIPFMLFKKAQQSIMLAVQHFQIIGKLKIIRLILYAFDVIESKSSHFTLMIYLQSRLECMVGTYYAVNRVIYKHVPS